MEAGNDALAREKWIRRYELISVDLSQSASSTGTFKLNAINKYEKIEQSFIALAENPNQNYGIPFHRILFLSSLFLSVRAIVICSDIYDAYL